MICKYYNIYFTSIYYGILNELFMNMSTYLILITIILFFYFQ